MGQTTTYLSAIAAACGRKVRYADLGSPDAGAVAELAREGGDYVCLADEPSWRLSVRAAALTLAMRPGPPDLLVYSCEEPKAPDAVYSGAADVLAALELPRLPAIDVTGNGCANLGPVLLLAARLVAAGDAAEVLVALTHRFPDDERLDPQIWAVRSDAAATGVVTADPAGAQYAVLGVGSAVQADLEPGSDNAVIGRATVAGVDRAVAALEARTGLHRGDFDHVLTNNYGSSLRALLAMGAGLKRDRLVSPTASAHGHFFAADPLVSLADLADDPTVAPGHLVLALTTSFRSWQAVGLRRCDA